MKLWELQNIDFGKEVQYWRMIREQNNVNGAFARPLKKDWILKICPTSFEDMVTMIAYEGIDGLYQDKIIEMAEEYSWSNLDELRLGGYIEPFKWNLDERKLYEAISDYKKIYKTKWGFPSEIENYLIQKNYKMIGDGHFSKVFARPNDSFVLKIGRTNYSEGDLPDGYLDYIKFLQQHKSNPHLPKVGKVREFTSKNGDTFYIIPVERLKEYTDEDPNEFQRWIYLYLFCLEHPTYKVRKTDDYYDLIVEYNKKYKELLPTINLIFHTFYQKYGIDFKLENLMKRGNTIVITDPLAYPVKD